MPKVEFVKNIQPLDVDASTTLMQALLKHGLPVASSCLGKGVCSKCRVQIVSGMESLSPETQIERGLRERNQIPNGWRISCQSFVVGPGNVTIDTTYW